MLAAAALAAVTGTSLAEAASGPLSTSGTPVGVAEREYRLSPYRGTVKPGVIRFNVHNFGEDVHDLVVISPKGRVLGTSGEIAAGGQGALRVKLKAAGVYRLLCTQDDHAKRGMKSRITVRGQRR
jgi:plastocyanin